MKVKGFLSLIGLFVFAVVTDIISPPILLMFIFFFIGIGLSDGKNLKKMNKKNEFMVKREMYDSKKSILNNGMIMNSSPASYHYRHRLDHFRESQNLYRSVHKTNHYRHK